MVGHTDLVSCCEVSPDGGKLISGGLDNTLRVWDIGTGKELGTYAFNSQIFALGVCPGESWLAVGYRNFDEMFMKIDCSVQTGKQQCRGVESRELKLQISVASSRELCAVTQVREQWQMVRDDW
jgi:WD40 repeat protein